MPRPCHIATRMRGESRSDEVSRSTLALDLKGAAYTLRMGGVVSGPGEVVSGSVGVCGRGHRRRRVGRVLDVLVPELEPAGITRLLEARSPVRVLAHMEGYPDMQGWLPRAGTRSIPEGRFRAPTTGGGTST